MAVSLRLPATSEAYVRHPYDRMTREPVFELEFGVTGWICGRGAGDGRPDLAPGSPCRGSFHSGPADSRRRADDLGEDGLWQAELPRFSRSDGRGPCHQGAVPVHSAPDLRCRAAVCCRRGRFALLGGERAPARGCSGRDRGAHCCRGALDRGALPRVRQLCSPNEASDTVRVLMARAVSSARKPGRCVRGA